MRDRDINQPGLAKILQVSSSAVSQKIGSNLTLDGLFEIAAALDVNPAKLVDASGPSLEDQRLSAISAILRADFDELHPVLDALKPVFDRIAKQDKRRPSTA